MRDTRAEQTRTKLSLRPLQTAVRLLAVASGLILMAGMPSPGSAADEQDIDIALNLAQFLRSARTVISSNQDLINNPDVGDKGLDGETVVAAAMEKYQLATGTDPNSLDPASLEGRLHQAQMDAIISVMEENQATINKQGLGFKGFVPAVFARLVNENFRTNVGQIADVKVTAPPELVRNRKALPDDWESQIIESELMKSDWPKDKIYTAQVPKNGREAFRILIPEYYSEGCLSCHGEPRGEIDVTGYPKEGGKLGDLGGVISIALFR
jgi:Protein of unknown function (DUF3365)